MGRWEDAIKPSLEAVSLTRELAKTNPGFLPDLALRSANLAQVYSTSKQASKALPLLLETIRSEVVYLMSQVPLLPEEQRKDIVAALANRWQIPFSLSEQSEAGAQLAMFTRLNRHGLLLDIQRRQALLTRNPTLKPLTDELQRIKVKLGSTTLPAEQRSQLQTQRAQLEQDLYRQLPQLKPDLVEPLQVAHRLPADGVLIEFQRFFPWVAPGLPFADSPRYLALILTPNGSITAVPLGEAKLIEDTIQRALRSAGGIPKSNANATPRQAMQALADVRRQLLDPLAPHIAYARQLFLSPDGEINNVPLAALPIRDSDPLTSPTLGDHKTLHLLTSGRDLLPSRRASRSTSQASLVIADPDYNASLPASPATAVTTTPESRSGDTLHKRWSPLLNTKAEGDAIRKLLGGTLLQGPQATTARLQQAQGPTILHIATHGFFLPDQPRNLNTADPFQSLTTLELPLLTQEDPLLRSGIVLAGANHPNANPTDDGRLTALEATALSLEGTELVTLSACSTGLGSIATGEGVYGLQRALQVAGARSTLLSLWKVDDAATRLFMEQYYSLLKQGIGRGEALRQVQQHFRNQPLHNHPHFWAAWQLSGDTGQVLNLRKGVHERDEP
jgi:CHAT domain-containing protein